ncbi:MAG: hypothetical protein ACWA5U_11070 [bacterium]
MDMAGFFERILVTTDAHLVTNLFLILIITIFLFSLVLAFIGQARLFSNYTPVLLTSLGILGTFTGIIIGLLGFNSSRIDESIELLLEGLKTAFITSLAGMASAIIYKIMGTTPFFEENRTTNEVIDVEPRDILKAIQRQEEHLLKLKKAISGDDDSSLVGQIKLLRSDLYDNYRDQKSSFSEFSRELWINLDTFSEMLSKSATEQVIKALNEVIADFNQNLTEQFGDNFKALDASVKKLVDWQIKYAEQIEQMILQYSHSVKAINDIEQSVTAISLEARAIPEIMQQLKIVVEVNQHQINELSRHLKAFEEMKEQAVKAIPEMQRHVEQTVESISQSSIKANEGYQSLLNSTNTIHDTFTTSINDIQTQLESTVRQLIEKQIYEMNRSFSSLEEEMTKAVDLTGKAVNKKVEMIDESMTKEVNRVMTEMGSALASISGQFTTDYKQLTQSMKKITNMSRG